MSASVFLLEPQSRRIEPLPFAPRDREQLAHVLGTFWCAPLEVRPLGVDVPGIGSHKDDIRASTLAIACGAQPALPGNEAGVYYVRGVPLVGRAVLTAQETGAGALGQSLTGRTHFLRLPWALSEAAETHSLLVVASVKMPPLPSEPSVLFASAMLAKSPPSSNCW